jgi:hypothetical protein
VQSEHLGYPKFGGKGRDDAIECLLHRLIPDGEGGRGGGAKILQIRYFIILGACIHQVQQGHLTKSVCTRDIKDGQALNVIWINILTHEKLGTKSK